MLQTYWLALAVFASWTLYCWSVQTERITLMTALSAFSWAILALKGGSVQQRVSGTGELVAAPIPRELRYFCLVIGVLSLFAFILYRWGQYPPEGTNGQDQTPEQEVDSYA